jgi:hypothetical protein
MKSTMMHGLASGRHGVLLQGLAFSQSNQFRCCNGATIPHIFKIVKSSRGSEPPPSRENRIEKEARKTCIICEEPAGPLLWGCVSTAGGPQCTFLIHRLWGHRKAGWGWQKRRMMAHQAPAAAAFSCLVSRRSAI